VGTKSEIGVDGHDVLLIPQSPNAQPQLTNSTWGGGGEGGWGKWGWGVGGTLGAVGYEKNIVYIICTHTHMLVAGLQWEKNWKFFNCNLYATIFYNFSGEMDENSVRS
jgi:hypothetical protein